MVLADRGAEFICANDVSGIRPRVMFQRSTAQLTMTQIVACSLSVLTLPRPLRFGRSETLEGKTGVRQISLGAPPHGVNACLAASEAVLPRACCLRDGYDSVMDSFIITCSLRRDDTLLAARQGDRR